MDAGGLRDFCARAAPRLWLERATRVRDRDLYIAAVLTSLVFSAWAGYAKFIPNPDAMYYLRSAEFFAKGDWAAGVVVYPWPFYSLLIAAVMSASGLTALVAVQVLNALLYVIATLSFIALISRLAHQDRFAVVFGALIVILHPQFMELRPFVIRDNGVYAFLLLSLYLVVRDHQQPSLRTKAGIAAAILVASLFRVEALLLALVAPAFLLYARAQSPLTRLLVIAATIFLAALIVPGYALWTGGFLYKWSAGEPAPHISAGIAYQLDVVRDRLHRLQTDILPYRGRNYDVVAYAGIVFAIIFDALLRALTWPLALLAAAAFAVRNTLPVFVSRFTKWFAAWQIPVLSFYATLNLFLDWRYAMTFALVMTVPAVFATARLAREWSAGADHARWLFPAALLLIVGAWASDLPKPHRFEYLREAGHWIKSALPADARVITNDARIAYFSGRPYETKIMVRAPAPPTEAEWAEADYLVVDATTKERSTYLANRAGLEPLGVIAQGRGGKVEAFRLK